MRRSLGSKEPTMRQSLGSNLTSLVVVALLAIASLKPADASVHAKAISRSRNTTRLTRPTARKNRSPSWPRATDGMCLLLRLTMIP